MTKADIDYSDTPELDEAGRFAREPSDHAVLLQLKQALDHFGQFYFQDLRLRKGLVSV